MIGPWAPFFERGRVTSCANNRALRKEPVLTIERSYDASSLLPLTIMELFHWMPDGLPDRHFSNSLLIS